MEAKQLHEDSPKVGDQVGFLVTQFQSEGPRIRQMNDVTLSVRGGPENLGAHCDELESPADGTPGVRVLKSRREKLPAPDRQEIHASSTSVRLVPQLTGCCPLPSYSVHKCQPNVLTDILRTNTLQATWISFNSFQQAHKINNDNILYIKVFYLLIIFYVYQCFSCIHVYAPKHVWGPWVQSRASASMELERGMIMNHYVGTGN